MKKKISRRPKPAVSTRFDSINKTTLGLFHFRLNEMLEKIGEEFGLVIEAGNITYEGNSFSGQYKAHLTSSSSGEEQLYNAFTKVFECRGNNPNVIIEGEKYKIVGYDKRRKKPILLEKDGKIYRVSITQIQQS